MFSRSLPRLLSAVIILLFLFRLSLFLLLLKSNHPSASSHRATVDIAVAAATLRRLYDCIMDNDLPGYRALSSWRCDGSGRRFLCAGGGSITFTPTNQSLRGLRPSTSAADIEPSSLVMTCCRRSVGRGHVASRLHLLLDSFICPPAHLCC